MRVAIDLDNTIVSYDAVFLAVARKRGLVAETFRGRKAAIRDAIRGQPGGELAWQALQGRVYGDLIRQAIPFQGVHEFIARARRLNTYLVIVSHKTVLAQSRAGGADLHHAARSWLVTNRLIGEDSVPERNLYFEPTRQAKLARISALNIDVVIDDLAEVLSDSQFPHNAGRWLFAPGAMPGRRGLLESFDSWDAMRYAFEQLAQVHRCRRASSQAQ